MKHTAVIAAAGAVVSYIWPAVVAVAASGVTSVANGAVYRLALLVG
jgi:hypothetical protein